MTITYKNGDVQVFNTLDRLNLQDDLLRANKLRANGYAWMYIGFGTMALGYILDLAIIATYGDWTDNTAFIPTALIVAGGGMVIGGGIAVLAGISQRNKATNALYSYTLFETPNSKLNFNLNPNSIGLALRF